MPGIRSQRIVDALMRLPPALTQAAEWLEAEEAEVEQMSAARELDISLLLNQVPSATRAVAERAYDQSGEDVDRALLLLRNVMEEVEEFNMRAWWTTNPYNLPTHLPQFALGEHMRSYEALGLNTHIRGTRPPHLSSTEILNQLALLEVSRADFPNATSPGARYLPDERMTDLAILVTIMDRVDDIDPAMVPIAPVLASMLYIASGAHVQRAAIGINEPGVVERCKQAILNGEFPNPAYYPNYHNMTQLAVDFDLRIRRLRSRRLVPPTIHHPMRIADAYTDREETDLVAGERQAYEEEPSVEERAYNEEVWETESEESEDEEPMPRLARASSSSSSGSDTDENRWPEIHVMATNYGPLHIPDRQQEGPWTPRTALSDRSWGHAMAVIQNAAPTLRPSSGAAVRPYTRMPIQFRNEPIPSRRMRARMKAIACYRDYLRMRMDRLEELVANGDIDEKTYMEDCNDLMEAYNCTTTTTVVSSRTAALPDRASSAYSVTTGRRVELVD
tara:strand:- start:129 stop:1643 length:1515 start_codon:yes stop_codon:yes gene_type:complete